MTIKDQIFFFSGDKAAIVLQANAGSYIRSFNNSTKTTGRTQLHKNNCTCTIWKNTFRDILLDAPSLNNTGTSSDWSLCRKKSNGKHVSQNLHWKRVCLLQIVAISSDFIVHHLTALDKKYRSEEQISTARFLSNRRTDQLRVELSKPCLLDNIMHWVRAMNMIKSPSQGVFLLQLCVASLFVLSVFMTRRQIYWIKTAKRTTMIHKALFWVCKCEIGQPRWHGVEFVRAPAHPFEPKQRNMSHSTFKAHVRQTPKTVLLSLVHRSDQTRGCRETLWFGSAAWSAFMLFLLETRKPVLGSCNFKQQNHFPTVANLFGIWYTQLQVLKTRCHAPHIGKRVSRTAECSDGYVCFRSFTSVWGLRAYPRRNTRQIVTWTDNSGNSKKSMNHARRVLIKWKALGRSVVAVTSVSMSPQPWGNLVFEVSVPTSTRELEAVGSARKKKQHGVYRRVMSTCWLPHRLPTQCRLRTRTGSKPNS